MSDLDLPSALRTELRSDRYALDVSSDAVLAGLDGRARRRARAHRWLVVVAASGSAAALIVAVFVLGSGGQRSNQPAGPPPASASSTVAASATPEVDWHPISGVPDYLKPSSDPAAAMAAEPPLAVRPTSGEAAAFRPATARNEGPVLRVVVVRGPEESVGLLGSPQQPEWAKASSLGGLMALVTDHEPSLTTYLMAFSPTGERWFIAVTAADQTVRMETMRAVATRTLR